MPEAPLEETEHGLVPAGEGWFVVNAREARWRIDELGAWTGFAGEARFEQVGINLCVLRPGVPMAMYHYENEQEDWGAYPVNEVALRHGASVEQETASPKEAYARFTTPTRDTRYQEGWLPG